MTAGFGRVGVDVNESFFNISGQLCGGAGGSAGQDHVLYGQNNLVGKGSKVTVEHLSFGEVDDPGSQGCARCDQGIVEGKADGDEV